MEEVTDFDIGRRGFLHIGAVIGTIALVAPAELLAQSADSPAKQKKHEEDISPTEDLMQEHGVLSRILLIYEQATERLSSGKEFPLDVIASAAGIVRRFVEDYHERNEEGYVFPRLSKPDGQPDLVRVLLDQHRAGRAITAQITGMALSGKPKTGADRARLVDAMRAFIHMYRPHKAREDTVLFPALRAALSKHEIEQMGDDFEKAEKAIFGEDGFQSIVKEVSTLETRLGVYDLAQFTPKL